MADEASIPFDRFKKAFEELEAQKTLIKNCTNLWKNLSDHFSSLEQTLNVRSQELDSKLQQLDSKANQTLETISTRESSIPSIESAAAALVEQRRESALSELESPADGPPPADVSLTIRRYFRRMDSAGLWRFILSRRKDLTVLRREIYDALTESVDPARLVLDAVEDFIDQPEKNVGPASGGGQDHFWACGMLLRSLFDVEGRKVPEVSRSIKERAGLLAKEWKKKVDERGENGLMGGSEAQMFLQLIVAFGVQSIFEEEFLKKLVLEFASRKDMPKLAARVGFGDRMGDIIDEMVKTGRELEAAYFAHECGLTERFSLVSLIKSYLTNSRKNANAILKKANHSMAAMEESSTAELNALRSIIKCVEALKLEREFSLDSLRKRISLLDKAKADRKKSAAANRSQNKRLRFGGATAHFRPAKATRTHNVSYPSFHRVDPYQIPAPRPQFSLSAPVAYEGPVSAVYSGAHSRSPASLSQQYYVAEDMGGGTRSNVAYGGGSSVNYSGYDYAAAGPTAPAQTPHPQ